MFVRGLLSQKGAGSIFDQPVVSGQDIVAHIGLNSAVFPRALREHGEGRFLEPDDKGKPNIVISRKIARDFPDEQGQPRKVGGSLRIGDRNYTIIGLYETGSLFLDVAIIMDIETARTALELRQGSDLEHLPRGHRPHAVRDAERDDREEPIPALTPAA